MLIIYYVFTIIYNFCILYFSVCIINQGSFTCRCCAGYVGKFCEERDGCYGNPCQHGGFCVDIAEGLVGTTFQCLCPHGNFLTFNCALFFKF